MRRIILALAAPLAFVGAAQADGLAPVGDGSQGRCYLSGSSGPQVDCRPLEAKWVLAVGGDPGDLSSGRVDGVPPFGVVRRHSGTTTLTSEAVQAQGSGSTGDASGMRVNGRTLADRAAERPSVLDTGTVKCDGISDDRAGLQAALDRAAARYESLYLPPARTCAYSGTLHNKGVRIYGSGTLSILKPLSATDAMMVFTGALAGVEKVQFLNQNGFAKSAIVLDHAEDALHTWIERNYFVAFNDAAVRREAGQHVVVRENVFINNRYAYIQNSSGINDVLEGNYVAGGSGFLFRKRGVQAMEGAIVRGNIVFATGNRAWTALTVEAGLDVVVDSNTFESDCNTVVYDGSNFGVAYIKSRSNWIGTKDPVDGSPCYAMTLKNQANHVMSDMDVIIGRGQRGVLVTADNAGRSNLAPAFKGTRFYGTVPATRSTQDMTIAHALGVIIQGVDFSGVASLSEGAGVSGRVDGSIWAALPNTIDAGLRYGVQTAGMTLRAKGRVGYTSGTTSQTISHGLSVAAGPADFTFTAANHPTNAVGVPAVTAVSAGSVTATLRGDPGASGAAYGWSVDRTR